MRPETIPYAAYVYQPETVAAAEVLDAGAVSFESHALGLHCGEPLIVAMDALIRYARAFRAHHKAPLASDYVLGPPWLDAAKGLKALLNGDGAVAMERDRSTDSKDNGCVERMFWDALALAGFTEEDL